jgi:hypothetical protein
MPPKSNLGGIDCDDMREGRARSDPQFFLMCVNLYTTTPRSFLEIDQVRARSFTSPFNLQVMEARLIHELS